MSKPVMLRNARPARTFTPAECRILMLLVLIFPASGCLHVRPASTGSWPECHTYYRPLDDCMTAKRAEQRAGSALRQCDGDFSCDYESGFVQAYVDVALGGCGEVPPVPPEHYWKFHRRDESGHHKAQQWFAGYSAGACHALGRRDHLYNDIPISGGLQTSCQCRQSGW